MTIPDYFTAGWAIAASVGAYFSHCRAWDAKRSRDEAYDLNEQTLASEARTMAHADRAERAAKGAKAHHDCVKTTPEPDTAFTSWLRHELDTRPVTDPIPTITIPATE